MNELIFDAALLDRDEFHSYTQMLLQDIRLRTQLVAAPFKHDLAFHQDDVSVRECGDGGVLSTMTVAIPLSRIWR
jgi:hypothetical protein